MHKFKFFSILLLAVFLMVSCQPRTMFIPVPDSDKTPERISSEEVLDNISLEALILSAARNGVLVGADVNISNDETRISTRAITTEYSYMTIDFIDYPMGALKAIDGSVLVTFGISNSTTTGNRFVKSATVEVTEPIILYDSNGYQYKAEIPTPVECVVVATEAKNITFNEAVANLVGIVIPEGTEISIDGTAYDFSSVGKLSNGESGDLLISDADDLFIFASLVNSGTLETSGIYVKLGSDIDLSDYDWIPIGRDSAQKNLPKDTQFQGCFDGDGHTISGLKSSGFNRVGLFGDLLNASVSNLILSGDLSDGQFAGLVAATATYNTAGEYSFESLKLNATVNDAEYAGIAIGELDIYDENVSLSIEGFESEGQISSASIGRGFGGFAGYVSNSGTITVLGGYNSADISVSETAGGLFGRIQNNDKSITIGKFTNTGNINTDREEYADEMPATAGGIVGSARNFGTLSFEGCINNGILSSEIGHSGGIIGYAQTGNALSISYSENNNAVSSQHYAGGFVGLGVQINTFNSVGNANTGSVSASHAGGFAGYITEDQRGQNIPLDLDITDFTTGNTITGTLSAGGVIGCCSLENPASDVLISDVDINSSIAPSGVSGAVIGLAENENGVSIKIDGWTCSNDGLNAYGTDSKGTIAVSNPEM